MIKNIVFDVGNVLVTFNPNAYLDKLGYDAQTKQAVEEAVFQHPLWNENDRGILSDEELLNGFITNAPEYEVQIRETFQKVGEAIELLPHTMGWVRELNRKGYRLYVLSNYGEYTYKQTEHKLKFLEYMDGVIFSYKYKMIKPEKEIYELLLNKYNLQAEETVFIDDKPENVEAAKALGFKGIQFRDIEQVKEELAHVFFDDMVLSYVLEGDKK